MKNSYLSIHTLIIQKSTFKHLATISSIVFMIIHLLRSESKRNQYIYFLS